MVVGAARVSRRRGSSSSATTRPATTPRQTTEIIQNGVIVLRTHGDAVRWNAALPCGGRITRVIRQRRDQVLVVFRLTERPGHHCDAPGIEAAAVFRVEHGKIVLWRQTVPPDTTPAPSGVGPSI